MKSCVIQRYVIYVFTTAVVATLVYNINSANGLYVPLTLEEMQRVVDYCYSHATSPNPIQDLVNAGLIPPEISAFSCSQIQTEKNNIELSSKAFDDLSKIGRMK